MLAVLCAAPLGVAQQHAQVLTLEQEVMTLEQEELNGNFHVGGHVNPDTLNFMRIPKTGSTSLLEAMGKAQKRHKACKPLRLHFHDITVDFLEPKEGAASLLATPALRCGPLPRCPAHPPSPLRAALAVASFAVLREPCERFISIYDHLVAHKALDAKDFATRNAMAWATLLKNNADERRQWLYAQQRAVPLHHRVPWQQTAYVGPHTATACLPTMHSDVQAIFDEHLPGCALPHIPEQNVASRHSALPSPQLCGLVRHIYPDDVRLWEERCSHVTNSTAVQQRARARAAGAEADAR